MVDLSADRRAEFVPTRMTNEGSLKSERRLHLNRDDFKQFPSLTGIGAGLSRRPFQVRSFLVNLSFDIRTRLDSSTTPI